MGLSARVTQPGHSMRHGFAAMLLDHLPKLGAIPLNMTRDHHVAEGLVQETAVRALRAAGRFAPGSGFGAWTYRIMKNRFLSCMRRRRRATVGYEAAAEWELGQPSSQEESVWRREVMSAVGRLDGGRQRLLVQVLHGHTYREISVRNGTKIGTLKSRVWRAKDRLREQLAEPMAC